MVTEFSKDSFPHATEDGSLGPGDNPGASPEDYEELVDVGPIAYRAIVNACNDAIVTTDGTGVIVAWNPKAVELFGYTASEALGQGVEMLMPSPHRHGHARHMHSAQFGETARVIGKSVDLKALRKDGREFDISLSLTRWELANQTYFTAFIRDITEQKENQKRLLILAEVVSQSNNSVVITDADATIEYVNQAFLSHTGYSLDEVIGENPRILHSGHTAPETFAEMWATLTRGETWKGEFNNRKKDGTLFVEYAIITPIRQNNGDVTHYVALKEDITEQKRIRKELDAYRNNLELEIMKRTAQLAEATVLANAANAAKSAFLANMSHEIRTPMHAITGLTNILLNSDPTSRQRERLKKIEVSAKHLLSIINRILDLSDIEAGRVELDDEDFFLPALIDNVRAMATSPLGDKQLPIQVDLRDVPQWLRGDSTRISQALLNYLSNAIKFAENGEISIRCRLVEKTDSKLLIRFEVSDTGVGIASEKLPYLFDAFNQADNSLTRKYGGSGLGLAITHRLATLMGGETGVVSELGKGSTFWFTAALTHGVSRSIENPETETTDLDDDLRYRSFGARVLVVDDVDVNTEVAQSMLLAMGISVDCAKNGQEAFEKERLSPYDLILMDVHMPIMNGIESARAIRQLPGRQHTPIIAMTADVFKENEKNCRAAGINDFLWKPVESKGLHEKLLAWLPRKNSPPPRNTSQSIVNGTPPPEHASTPSLRQKLADIPGFNGDQGIERLRGNERKFLQVIELFVRQHRDDFEKITHALERENVQEIELLVHALKGSAGLIGGVEVAEIAQRITTSIRNKENIETLKTHIQALEVPFKALIAGLEGIVITQTQTKHSEVMTCDAASAGLLAELESLLTQGFIDAQGFIETRKQAILERYGQRGADMLTAIRLFDYRKALLELDAIKKESRS